MQRCVLCDDLDCGAPPEPCVFRIAKAFQAIMARFLGRHCVNYRYSLIFSGCVSSFRPLVSLLKSGSQYLHHNATSARGCVVLFFRAVLMSKIWSTFIGFWRSVMTGKRRVLGGVPEWLKGTGCKPVGYAYVGSNPTPSTITGLQCAGLVKVSFVGTEAV